MNRYPHFVAAVDGFNIDRGELSKRSGVPVDVIEALLAGEHAAGLADQMRLGRALSINPLELFALDPDTEALLADRERQGLPRWAVDQPALRAVDR